ncbi:MAG TPA: helix-turn-helix transcriptional regulator [Bradyrhizobium sp.]|nr:helix-turn-helix transcriptional regulator [Bradyrhizobium sp.]
MFGESTDGSAFEFSTDRLPEQDRVRIWCDVVARQGMRIESQPLPGSTLKVDIRGYAWPGIMIARAHLSGLRDERTPELLADGEDNISIIINLAGPVTIKARSNENYLNAGEGFAISALEPSVFTRPTPGSVIGLSLPRQALTSRVRNLDAVLMRVIPAKSEPLQILKAYVGFLLDYKGPTTEEVRRSIATHLYQLVAHALGPSPDIAMAMEGRSTATARLIAIKADVLENLGNRELTTDWLALRHHVSARYVQMLFENDDTTLSAFLLERRLERAHDLLGHRGNNVRSIGAIALECGFGDLSYFNRAFKKRFAVTPSERRADAIGES